MARPRTKGPTIPVQLPLMVDRQVRERAEQQGVSPGRLLAQWVTQRVVAEVEQEQ